MYLECKTENSLGITCLGKKLVFHTEISDYFEYFIFKYSIFHRVTELFKSIQTQPGMEYPMCTRSVKQREFLV